MELSRLGAPPPGSGRSEPGPGWLVRGYYSILKTAWLEGARDFVSLPYTISPSSNINLGFATNNCLLLSFRWNDTFSSWCCQPICSLLPASLSVSVLVPRGIVLHDN